MLFQEYGLLRCFLQVPRFVVFSTKRGFGLLLILY